MSEDHSVLATPKKATCLQMPPLSTSFPPQRTFYSSVFTGVEPCFVPPSRNWPLRRVVAVIAPTPSNIRTRPKSSIPLSNQYTHPLSRNIPFALKRRTAQVIGLTECAESLDGRCGDTEGGVEEGFEWSVRGAGVCGGVGAFRCSGAGVCLGVIDELGTSCRWGG
jgi:hypothetical protein